MCCGCALPLIPAVNCLVQSNDTEAKEPMSGEESTSGVCCSQHLSCSFALFFTAETFVAPAAEDLPASQAASGRAAAKVHTEAGVSQHMVSLFVRAGSFQFQSMLLRLFLLLHSSRILLRCLQNLEALAIRMWRVGQRRLFASHQQMCSSCRRLGSTAACCSSGSERERSKRSWKRPGCVLGLGTP